MPVVVSAVWMKLPRAYAQPVAPYNVAAGTTAVIDKNTTINTDSASVYGQLTVDGGVLNETSTNTGSHKVGIIYVNGAAADNALLTVQNGGSLVTAVGGNIVAGLETGNFGTLTATGAGSSLSSTFLQAGNYGDGTVNILNGATATANTTVIANFLGTTGILNLSGAGSTLTTDLLYVNGDGHGAVTIDSGARAVVNAQVIFGSQGPGHGELDVQNGGTLSVGGVNRIVDNEGAGGSYVFKIDNGTLENIQSDLVTAVTINVANTATIQTNNFVTGLFGVLYGTGGVTKEGSGTLLLTADNTYTGATTIAQGALQLGLGGTTGSIASSVIHNNGMLVFNRSDTLGVAGAIDGTGNVVQAGKGTTVLSADNTYTGATTIMQGTLQLGNGGTTGGIASSAIHNGGTLVVDRSNTLALDGKIDGQGNFVQAGKGTTVLSGDNTYTGATTIAQGTLQLGAGGTTGSISASSAIHNNGTLAVDHSNTTALSQSIDGTGNFVQAGTGTTVLSADNTYTGATTIAQGALQLGTGGTTGSVSASSAIHNNGLLVVDRSNTAVLSQVIDGTGSVAQAGTGTTVLSADNTYTGATTIAQGTLQLGNGGTTGSIASSTIHNNGALVTDRSNTLLLAGAIDGTGSLNQNGTGTTVLGGNNTYTGATTITKGTLQLGNGGTTGSIASSTIHNNGALVTDRSNTLLLAGTIDGTGSLNQNGTGTTVLGENNTYTGATTITKGTLQLGNGGTTGAVASSAIHNNGTLAVNRSNTAVLSQGIDGTGSVAQAGTGTTVLSANNTYTGATSITQGKLQLGNGGTTGAVASSVIHNNGTLVVDRSNTAVLSQVIDGTGNVVQAGSGTTVLSADNTYTGTTTVQSGVLEVEGAIASSTVNVLSGAALVGTGTAGSMSVAAGATLAPTGTRGVLNVQGNLEMNDGATLSVHENHQPSGTTMAVYGQTYQQLYSGRVAVSGSTALTGTLNVNVIPGTFLKSHEYYTLITSSGGFSSKTDALQSNLLSLYTFISPSLYYTGNDLDLLLYRNNVTFSSVGQTRNEREVARVLDTLPESNAVVQGMESLNAADARQSMNALSGELYASARTALIQDSVYVRQAVLDRLDTADCREGDMRGAIHTASLATGRKDEGCLSGQAVLWGEAYGGLGRNNGDGNAANMHHSTTGFIMGIDAPIMDGRWRIGGLFSYGRSMFDIQSGRGSSGHSNNITVGGYAGTHWGNLNLKLGAAYTWNMLSMQRNVAISDYTSRQSSSYSGGTAQAFGELGYRFHTGYGTIEPFGNVAYVNLDTNGYQEEGGAAALQGRGMDTGVTFSTFGVKMFKPVRAGSLLLLPHGTLAYRRAFGQLTPTSHTMLASANTGGGMEVAGVPLSQDAAVVDAGLNIQLTDLIDVGLSYIGQYGNQSVESGAMGQAHFRF
ncbi:autotransporter domain-containing protein [Acetobacter suratthaniensis]|uniref:Autotransporter domain-containing protein n=1 Tax=Acetobacter suratthaniensis TaxID=1502841 RepID=A0ABS3LPH1_9PROT|nr:autotransporter-associated beta strand repeat-containing protein [Acetobacter suratthaniensis]MBO1329271.1 autotransporter domain-containing protein [Acetobacter suratthaniensis]